jgi:hypothetical protein
MVFSSNMVKKLHVAMYFFFVYKYLIYLQTLMDLIPV